jgi:predicted nucleic acid-binding Zn ribbon protein
MTERLVQHRHCKACGKAVAPDDETCSDECKAKWEAQKKSRKNTMWLFYLSIAVLLVVLALSMSGKF